MKIYFAGSIRGEQPNKEWFQTLIQHISKQAKVLTEHSFDYSYEDEIKVDDQWIYETDMKWLQEADGLIAEVTAPSLGVGYEIGKAEDMNKPTLLLYRYREGKKPSAMLNGNKNMTLFTYHQEKEAIDAIDSFLNELGHDA